MYSEQKKTAEFRFNISPDHFFDPLGSSLTVMGPGGAKQGEEDGSLVSAVLSVNHFDYLLIKILQLIVFLCFKIE